MTVRDQVDACLEGALGAAVLDTSARDVLGDRRAPCRVATYRDQPIAGAFTLVTRGLSETPVRGPEAELVRQELLFCAWDRFRQNGFYPLLFAVAQLLHDGGETFNPGAVLDLPQPAPGGMSLRHLFLYPPVYHVDALQSMRLDDGEEVEILWLIPITAEEAAFVAANGPEAFDDLLEKADPDLLDLGRASMV